MNDMLQLYICPVLSINIPGEIRRHDGECTPGSCQFYSTCNKEKDLYSRQEKAKVVAAVGGDRI